MAGRGMFGAIYGVYATARLSYRLVRAIVLLPFRIVRSISLAARLSKTQRAAVGATVGHVADGDTLALKLADGSDLRVRIAWMDAPEHGQAAKDGFDAGEGARRSLALIAKPGSEATIRPIDVDVYGRTVAQVFVGGVDVGLSQLRTGNAITLEGAPRGYRVAEKQARSAHAGAWGHGGFEEPKAFRRRHPWDPQKDPPKSVGPAPRVVSAPIPWHGDGALHPAASGAGAAGGKGGQAGSAGVGPRGGRPGGRRDDAR